MTTPATRHPSPPQAYAPSWGLLEQTYQQLDTDVALRDSWADRPEPRCRGPDFGPRSATATASKVRDRPEARTTRSSNEYRLALPTL